jgi:hypothetical protein
MILILNSISVKFLGGTLKTAYEMITIVYKIELIYIFKSQQHYQQLQRGHGPCHCPSHSRNKRRTNINPGSNGSFNNIGNDSSNFSDDDNDDDGDTDSNIESVTVDSHAASPPPPPPSSPPWTSWTPR